MLTSVCCLVVGFGLGLGLDLVPGWWLVSGYAHVFIQFSVVPNP